MTRESTEPPDDLPMPRWYGRDADRTDPTHSPMGSRPPTTARDVDTESARLSDSGDTMEHATGEHSDDHRADSVAGRDPGGVEDGVKVDAVTDRAEEVRSAALGPNASVREISRAARSAFVGKDLVQSGPALWPFGRRAQQRRARNHHAAAEGRRRRAQFRDAFDTQSTTQSTPHPSRWRSVDRRTNAVVIACLAGAVLAVVVVAASLGQPDARRASDAAPPSLSRTSSAIDSRTVAATTTGLALLPPLPPIPTEGVDPVNPRPGTSVDPRSVQPVNPPDGDPTPAELSTPAGAMRAWLARLCPFDFTDAFGAPELRARPAMTEAGWDTLDPERNDNEDRARASWDKTVAARESGRCAEPAAAVSPEAPRSRSSVIVVGAATRVVTAQDGAERASYVEELSEVRLVRRGADGRWRVDLAAVGG